LKATLITLCFIFKDDLQINILNFVTGHGTIVQQHGQHSEHWPTYSVITHNVICCYR